MRVKSLLICVYLLGVSGLSYADQLAFGTFRSQHNAQNWAHKLSQAFAHDMQVRAIEIQGEQLFRVSSSDLTEAQFLTLRRRADSAGIQYWRLLETTSSNQSVVGDSSDVSPEHKVTERSATQAIDKPTSTRTDIAEHEVTDTTLENAPSSEITAATESRSNVRATPQLGGVRLAPPSKGVSGGDSTYEWEFGLQSRLFPERGQFGQDRGEVSLAGQVTYYRAWNGDEQSLTITPFMRVDSADSERTHGDLREFFYSRVGDDWDIHVGAKRVFWGVTEFHHLVDIINQTDLIENLDGEDKLGQPMVQLSLVRDWGILELFALAGARQRTYAGDDGRLRLPFDVLDNADFESGADEYRLDGAIRWSHYMGPFEVGLHHFSGTSREPMLLPELAGTGEIVLRQYYPVIDQTGIDAQAFYGDWAFKMEGFSRAGYGDRYAAVNVGFERTIVGIFGTSADFGIVGEYMFDERGDDAVNTLFENDFALGGRLLLNDFADTKGLLGIVVDTNNDEYFVSLEASRRLSDSWLFSVEGRLFGGGRDVDVNNLLSVLTDAEFKSSWLQRDDYLQLEFRKYF